MFDGFPKALRIGHLDIEIQVVDKLPNNDWGLCEHDMQLIQVRRDCPSKAFAVETVIHEIMHMIFTISGLVEKEETEERLVTVFASGWTQVWRDNPKLLQWIVKVLK